MNNDDIELNSVVFIDLVNRKIIDGEGVERDFEDAKFIMVAGDDIIVRTSTGKRLN